MESVAFQKPEESHRTHRRRLNAYRSVYRVCAPTARREFEPTKRQLRPAIRKWTPRSPSFSFAVGRLVNLGKLTGSRGSLESIDRGSRNIQSARDIDYVEPAASTPSPNCRGRHADLLSPKVERDQ